MAYSFSALMTVLRSSLIFSWLSSNSRSFLTRLMFEARNNLHTSLT
jgi:hypothetical protein